MTRLSILVTARISVLVLAAILSGCGAKNTVNPELSTTMPTKIIWAWERGENLTFLDAKEYGVAFLAQTIFLERDSVIPKPRRQPLSVSPGTYMIAVTRIETKKPTAERPTFSPEMANKVVALVKNTLDLPDVKAVQIDFDAVVSERDFYRRFMVDLRKALSEPPVSAGGQDGETKRNIPLTMTSLASWCTGDAWFNDFPVDEAVPMVFEMGADSDKIKNYLRSGNDWQEPLCRGSYGISINETRYEGLKSGRRTYYFSYASWKRSDILASQP